MANWLMANVAPATRKSPRSCRVRSVRGSGIVEGAVGLIMVLSAVVGGTLLLVNCGVATYYKEKLGFAAQQIANFAANLPTGSDPVGPTTNFAREFFRITKLPNAQVSVSRITIAGEAAVRVSVQAKALDLIGHGDIVPAALSISETAVALRHSWKPDYLLTLSLRQNYGDSLVTVPCYGRQFEPGFSGGGAQNLPRGTAGRFWMNFPSGGFTASINGKPSEQYFGDGSISNSPGRP